MVALARTTARSAIPLLVAALSVGILLRTGLAPAGTTPLVVLAAGAAVLWWWESTLLADGLRRLGLRRDRHLLDGREVLKAFHLNPLALLAHPAGGTIAYGALSAQLVLTLQPDHTSLVALAIAAVLGGLAGRSLAGAAALRFALPRIGDGLADELRSGLSR